MEQLFLSASATSGLPFFLLSLKAFSYWEELDKHEAIERFLFTSFDKRRIFESSSLLSRPFELLHESPKLLEDRYILRTTELLVWRSTAGIDFFMTPLFTRLGHRYMPVI